MFSSQSVICGHSGYSFFSSLRVSLAMHTLFLLPSFQYLGFLNAFLDITDISISSEYHFSFWASTLFLN